VLNFSVLDGWFDEAYETSGGWAIGDRAPYTEDQDEIHASSIYSTLENEIVPLFYNRPDDELPTAWLKRMKTCIANITPHFGCGRMLAEYMSELYQPAHNLSQQIAANNFAEARKKSGWEQRVQQHWDRIRFVALDGGPGDSVMSGSEVSLRATVDLAGLDPAEVRVEAVIGQVGPNGELLDTHAIALLPVEKRSDAVVFANQYTVQQTGRAGYSVRISPNHFANPLTRPCNAPLKWVSD
jgi:glycogen phosphorylase